MDFAGPTSQSDSALADAEATGLSPEFKVALGEAAGMISNGHTSDAAVNHLTSKGMPRVVAKVLVKQYDKRNTN